jgi:protocatechuate 3,4-dioxygenase, alpha subunit
METNGFLQTPSQTVGPYFAYGLTPEQYLYDFKSAFTERMVEDREDEITITGQVVDGAGDTIPDAMIELWQNDGENALFGRYGTGTDPQQRFKFHTIKPKSVDGQAPFITAIVFMRGQLIHSYTRIYFEDEAELNATDLCLAAVSEERRKTLLAKKIKADTYLFDIHMQGEKETVFFSV